MPLQYSKTHGNAILVSIILLTLVSAGILISYRNLEQQRNVNQHIQEQCLARAMSDLSSHRVDHFNVGVIRTGQDSQQVKFNNHYQVVLK